MCADLGEQVIRGRAWGENIGWINFDLTGTAEGSVAKTSWTPPAKLAPTVTMTVDNETSYYGQPVRLRATVTGGSVTPTGTVTWRAAVGANSQELGSSALDVNGIAQYQIAILSPATRDFAATYSGDQNYELAYSNSVMQTVVSTLTTTTITNISPSQPTYSQQITVEAKVVPQPPGAWDGPPPGTVVLLVDGTQVGETSLDSQGKASFVIGPLSAQTHSLVARYLPPDDHRYVNSDAQVTQEVLDFNTPAGTHVFVQPTPPGSIAAVTLTFANVTAPGQTTVTTSQTGQPPSHGFKLGNPPVYVDISTTAQYSGSITICIDYSQIQFGPGALGLCHLEGGTWANRTSSLDAAHHRICATVSSLSPFAIFEAYDADRPQLSLPASLTVEATGPTGAVVTYSTSAVDAVDGEVPVSCSPASGATFALGSTTVNCEASDRAGNRGTGSFPVIVRDTIPRSVVVPGTLTAEATSAAGAAVVYTAAANDLVGGPFGVTCDHASGSVFPLGSTTVNCSATDPSGNEGRGAFVVNVRVTWSNFLQPINRDNSSVFKLGSTVPVKFRLAGASAAIQNLTAKLLVAKLSEGIAGIYIEATSTSSADSGNLFRYDVAGGQYIFNLGTKGLSNGTWAIKVDLGDGTNNVVLISLRR